MKLAQGQVRCEGFLISVQDFLLAFLLVTPSLFLFPLSLPIREKPVGLPLKAWCRPSFNFTVVLKPTGPAAPPWPGLA